MSENLRSVDQMGMVTTNFNMLSDTMEQKIIHAQIENIPCDESTIITDFISGEILCQKCGYVIQERVSDMRKNHSFFGNKDNSHAGDKIGVTKHDFGLSTVIGKSNTDFVGKHLGVEMHQSMKRIRLLDSRCQIKPSERNLRHALYEMYKIKEKCGLSESIIERAAYLYRKAMKSKLIRGRSVNSMVGACLYAACREMNTPRTVKDLSIQLQIGSKLIAKSYRLLFQNLEIMISPPNTLNVIVKIVNNLQASEFTKRNAIQIFKLLQEKGLTEGKNPNAVAATVIYMSGIQTNANFTQQEITEISGITGVTIRNRLRDYKKHIPL